MEVDDEGSPHVCIHYEFFISLSEFGHHSKTFPMGTSATCTSLLLEEFFLLSRSYFLVANFFCAVAAICLTS
jgi:hypothetical protein